MPEARVLDDVPEIAAIQPEDLPIQPLPDRVLMAQPTHYDVTRPDNPHTTAADGQLHRVDQRAAATQWRALRDAYADLGFQVETLEGHPDVPDLVFPANTVLPFLDEDRGRRFIPGRMRHAGRQGEVPLVSGHLEGIGYRPVPLPDGLGPMECNGDLVWWHDRRLVFAGLGDRTDRKALEATASILDVPAVALELPDPAFYHLDTCLAVLDGSTVAYVPEAFTSEGRDRLEVLVETLIPVDEAEARRGLACNLHCPDGQHVLIDEANQATITQLERHGYDPVPLDTGEFRKAGGSVFCMKNMLW